MKLFPVVVGYIFLLITTFGVFALIQGLRSGFGKSKFPKKINLYIFTTITIWFIISILSVEFKFEYVVKALGLLNVGIFVFNLSLLISLLFSFLWLFFVKKIKYKTSYSESRRDFLKRGVFIFPALSFFVGGRGFYEGFSSVKIPKIDFYFDNLPDELDGFKIAHLTDLHLGYFVRVKALEDMLKKISLHSPDILLITGDFIDDYDQLKDGVRTLTKLAPPFGVYSTVGNHEYLRGVKEVKKEFIKNNIPYLISEGIEIPIKNSSIFIVGADDPKKLRGINKRIFYSETIKKGIETRKNGVFTILITHRPDGFLVAEQFGIDLTLAGHTHGGQIGLNGRSLFEPILNKNYFWGKYEHNGKKLYTSSGAGHWFPFRINCPTEFPIITLRKSKII